MPGYRKKSKQKVFRKERERRSGHDGNQRQVSKKTEFEKKVMEGDEDKIEEDSAVIFSKTIEAAAGKGCITQKLKEKTLYRVRRRMSDFVRRLLQDARKRFGGECSRNKPGKQGLNTW